MTFTAFFDEHLAGQPVMGVFRNMPPAAAVARAMRAWDAGARHVEIPVQTPDAMPTLEAVVAAAREHGLVVGAGTIVTVEQLDAVHKAGAAYTVSPGLDAEIVAASVERGLPHLPGVATASEIQQARGLGLRWTKAFPASVLGASWIKAMLGPFPDQRFVVTGGMNADTAPAFLQAGARTVAVGDAFDDDAQLSALTQLIYSAS
jgi:2-dehydro-3-deoxyphosphogluconate aldolase / (4S)-4-hydroxy-2-oxoglutarate aldolase